MRLILGDGEIIDATQDNAHADLFFGTFGSYASLGILISVELKFRASRFVRVNYESISVQDAVVGEVLCDFPGLEQMDFCEGVIFDKDRAARVTAKFLESNTVKTIPHQGRNLCGAFRSCGTLGRLEPPPLALSLGCLVFGIHRSMLSDAWSEVVPTIDYLFRWDRGAYWCASIGACAIRPVWSTFMGWYFTAQRAYSIGMSASEQ